MTSRVFLSLPTHSRASDLHRWRLTEQWPKVRGRHVAVSGDSRTSAMLGLSPAFSQACRCARELSKGRPRVAELSAFRSPLSGIAFD